MILYRNCKIYRAGDKSKRTVKLIDVQSETPLFDNLGWSSGDVLLVESSKTVTTTHDFEYTADNYNIIFSNGIDLKITGVSWIQENVGTWKPRKRYKLTVTG